MSVPRAKWRRLPIVDLCEQHVDCVNRTAPVVDEPTPFKMIRTTNVRNGFIDVEKVNYVSEAIYNKWTRRLVPRRGDIILTREAPLGDVGKVRTDDLIFLGQRLYHFRPDPSRLDPDFLLYALMAPDLQAQVRGFGSGATVEHMRLGDIPRLAINVPTIEEQRQIGGMLAAYDDLFENNLCRIQVLEEMGRALYREWFVDFRFPGRQHGGVSRTSHGTAPSGWTFAKLDTVAMVNQAQIDTKVPPERLMYIDIASVGPGTVREITPFAFEDAPGRARRIVKHGDVLWSCVRPNRRSHVLMLDPEPETVVSTGFAVLTATKVPYTFLYQATTTDEFVAYLTNHATGAAYPAVTARTFEDAEILLPPEPLLSQFAELTVPQAELIAILQRQNVNLRETRDLLLPRLLSGQLSLVEINSSQVTAAAH